MKKPEMIFFDYGHTLLYEPDWDSERGDLALLSHAARNPKNAGIPEIRREIAAVFGEIDRVRGEEGIDLSCRAGNRLAYGHLGIVFDLTPLEVENVFWTAAAPGAVMPGAAEMLEAVRRMGIRTAVISNNGWSGEALEARFARLLPDFCPEFVLSSADYMIRKPDRRLFEVALALADLPPEAVWHCGDSFAADVRGAAGAGIFPVYYTDPELGKECPEEDPPAPFSYLRVRRWEELTAVLAEAE